jgi:hypothetical protein
MTEDAEILQKDPHYNELGFFDIHLCNWPERKRFFKILFSTAKYDNVESMEVLTPEGKQLAVLSKQKFMLLQRKGKPDKRVFMVNMDVPDTATTGWYSIRVRDHQGHEYDARDYVVMSRLQRVTGMSPSGDAENVALPVTLKWDAVPGANWYQVYVRDVWTDEMVFHSKLINEPFIKVPEGKLEAGGYYSWTVHARDTNEHILLGDFHMGSMSEKAYFTVAEAP